MEEFESDYEEMYEDESGDVESEEFSATDILSGKMGSEADSTSDESDKESTDEIQKTAKKGKEPPLKHIISLLEAEERKKAERKKQMEELSQSIVRLNETTSIISNKVDELYKLMEVISNSYEGEKKTSWIKRLKRKKNKKDRTKKEEFLELLTRENFSEDQLKEIQDGINSGLEISQVKSYSKKEFSSESMRRIKEIYIKMKGCN